MPLPQPDPHVLEAACRGDERAFDWIVQTYQRPVLSYVFRLVGERTLAEDLTQEIFLRVYQSLPRFSGGCLFTSWLFQITKNRVIDERRAQDRRPLAAVELDEAVAGRAVVEAPSETDEMIAAIWQVVSELELGLKMALLLRDVVGLPYVEIAEALDVDLGTVKWRIYRARELVQHALAARGLSPDLTARQRAASTKAGSRTAAAPAS